MSKRRGVPPLPSFILLITRRQLDENGCWRWRPKHRDNGYAVTSRGSVLDGTRRLVFVHRLSHEVFKGPIPPGMEVDHLCRVRDCYNPEHLEAVSPRENVRRALPYRKKLAPKNKGKRSPTCSRGHLREQGKSWCNICRTEDYYAKTGRYYFLEHGPEGLTEFIVGEHAT